MTGIVGYVINITKLNSPKLLQLGLDFYFEGRWVMNSDIFNGLLSEDEDFDDEIEDDDDEEDFDEEEDDEY